MRRFGSREPVSKSESAQVTLGTQSGRRPTKVRFSTATCGRAKPPDSGKSQGETQYQYRNGTVSSPAGFGDNLSYNRNHIDCGSNPITPHRYMDLESTSVVGAI